MEEYNNYSLIAYNPNNKDSIKYIEIKDLKKYNLALIDSYLTTYTKERLLERLQNNCILTPDQTEFAIVYKQDNRIKKVPVIFHNEFLYSVSKNSDGKIKDKDNEEVNRFRNQFLNNLTRDKHIIINKKSINPDYDFRKDETLYCYDVLNYPFVLAKLKTRIIEYITSNIFKEKYGNNSIENELIRKNNNAKYAILGDLNRYDIFRNVWLIKKGYVNMKDDFELKFNDDSKASGENLPKEKIKTVIDEKENKIDDIDIYSNILTSIQNEDFLDMIYDSSIITKKFKDTANRYNKSYYMVGSSDYEDNTLYLLYTMKNNKKINIEIMKIYKNYIEQNIKKR